jgi:SAM-dependent methyltransferase
MSIYGRYAEIYDRSGQIAFGLRMIPYLDEVLQRHPVSGRSLLDLACGTGTVALSFARQGWEVYGVDGSASMLAQARHKAQETNLLLALSQQDMRSFRLPHRVALVTCLYDSLNYMLTLDDLSQVFQRVSEVLLPGGLFLGDMNTQEMIEHDWDNNTFFVDGHDLAVVLQSEYDPQTRIGTVHLVGFEQQADVLYSRFDEEHAEIAYSDSATQAALEGAGLRVEAAYQCFGFAPPDAETRRILWVARKPEAQA